jgi:hypothetical protein
MSAYEEQQGDPLKARVLTALAALTLAAGAPPIAVDSLRSSESPIDLNRLGEGQAPIVDVQTYVQHFNILTS